MLRSALLRRHLSEDQRACLGDDLREYQSAIRKSERAAKAAAAKAGSLSSESDDRVVDSRIDSRKEAAIQFKISENKLKSLALIRRHEREHKVPADRACLGGRPRPAGRIIIEARRFVRSRRSFSLSPSVGTGLPTSRPEGRSVESSLSLVTSIPTCSRENASRNIWMY